MEGCSCPAVSLYLPLFSIWERVSGGSRISQGGGAYLVGKGAHSQCGYMSRKNCVKMKESVPSGGSGGTPGSVNASFR